MSLFPQKSFIFLVFLTISLHQNSKATKPKEETYQQSHSTLNILEKELILISNGETERTISIENLLEMVRQEKLQEDHAILLWESLNSLNEATLNASSIYLENESTIETVPEENEKSSMGFYQLMIIMLVGYFIVGLLMKGLITSLYLNENFKALFVLLLFLSYNLFLLARSLQNSMEANFFSAIIYNTIFVNLIIVFHLILLKFKVQTVFQKDTEIFNNDINITGKICMSIFGLSLGYFFSFSCLSPFVQIPFYFFLFYTVNVSRKIYISKFPEICEPNILFSFALFSLLLSGYLYLRGPESFHEWLLIIRSIGILDYFFSSIGQTKLINSVDFRFFGYLICLTVINTILPIYLFIQNKKLWAEEFNYENVLLKLKEEIAKKKMEFNASRLYFLIYGVIVIFSVIFTLREKFLLGTFISLFCLVNILNMTLRNDTLIGKGLSFVGGFFLLSAIHFVGMVDDQFTPLVQIVF